MTDLLIVVLFFGGVALFALFVIGTLIEAAKKDGPDRPATKPKRHDASLPSWGYEGEAKSDLPALLVPGNWGGRGKDYRRAPFAVIDLETTGFSAGQDRVVEVAVVRIDRDGRILSEWSTTVNPVTARGAEDIHQLTSAELASSPRFEEIADELLAHLSGAVIAAHNYSFEDRFLRAEFQLAGIEIDRMPALCTLQLARRAFPHFRKHTMDHCCKELNITNPMKHSALGDTLATVQLMGAALPLVPRPTFTVAPLPYRTIETTCVAPRGVPAGETGVVQPGQPEIAEPMKPDTIHRELCADGFAPTSNYPHGFELHAADDGIVTVSCVSTDPDIAEREAKRMAKSLRDLGYIARMGRQDGVPRVTVRSFGEA